MPASGVNVFVNCPFDDEYQPLFYATVFTIIRCGFAVRCSLEADNAAENRLGKIQKIIRESPYGVHDISRTESNGKPPLPRFNMPFELGLFLGASCYGGGKQRQKSCIVFDAQKYRYQKFLSDIAGQDIHSHGRHPATLIKELTTWLRMQKADGTVPGGQKVVDDFRRFMKAVPTLCAKVDLLPEELGYTDIVVMVETYMRENAPALGRA